MWLVALALRRPVSILSIALALILYSSLALRKIPIDMFPALGVPVVYVAQPYGGLDPSQMEGYVSSYYEYHFLYITGIKEVESRSIQGVTLIKLVFHPDTNMSQAVAETVAQVNRSRAFMPPGTVPPFIVRFDAGSVPVGNLVFSSKTRSLAEIQDLALFKVRPMFASLPGVSAPPPIGNSQRTIVVHVDSKKLGQYNLSADQVVQAVSAGNTITPAGNVRIGNEALLSPSNAVVSDIKTLEDIPISSGAGASVYVRDVGWVENSSDIISGYALVNGKRAIYIPVTKRPDASTWSVVQGVKKALPGMQEAVPPDIKVAYEFDQSGYVINALKGLFFEGALGAVLTGLAIFCFLRDIRSSLIVIITIPLALLSAAVALRFAGQTINIMTLSGLALAVGILVDEATVTIENVHSHHARNKSFPRAVIDSAREISIPKFLILICMLSVFVPAFFMTGVPGALFMPLSLAVGFSMTASFLVSQTLMPILIVKLMKPATRQATRISSPRTTYANVLRWLFPVKWVFIPLYLGGCFYALFLLSRSISIEMFPVVDTGEFKIRMRAPIGTRVEHTENIAHELLDAIASMAGTGNVETTLSFVGTQPPNYPINTIYLWTSGPHEAVITIALKRNSGIHLAEFKEQLRKMFAKQFSDVSVSFEPGDMVGQITNLGAPTPVEIAVVGKNMNDNKAFAGKLEAELKTINELRDLQIGEALDYPALNIDIDRIRAGQLGVTVDQVAKSLVAATSSSRYTTPNFWLDKTTGTAYQVQVEVPQSEMQSLEDVKAIPVIANSRSTGPFIRDVASISSGVEVGEVHRLNNQRILTLTANIQSDNLKRIADEIHSAIKRAGELPRGMKLMVRGQIGLLLETLDNLQTGMMIAVTAIFLLLAANFQSFMLAFLSLVTVPATLSGSGWMLYLTNTSLNIQSYLGAIMALGVSASNSILLVTFAEHLRQVDGDAENGAIEGGARRIRPIIMTTLAMLAGMTPMALALGEGGEQTAPLGRAVIGGLLASTVATLLLLPMFFAVLRKTSFTGSASLHPDDPAGALHEPAIR